jgi:hypothetical protein
MINNTSSKQYNFVNVKPAHISETLVDELTSVAKSGFGSSMTREDVSNHVRGSDEMMVVYKDGRPVAFGLYKILNQSLAYLSGSVVEQGRQKDGIYTELVKKRIEFLRQKVDYVSIRTQNPLVYHVFAKSVSDMYPGRKPVDEKIISMARMVDDRIDRDMIVRGCYGRRLADIDFKPRDAESAEVFRNIDVDKGDAIVLIGSVKGETHASA